MIMEDIWGKHKSGKTAAYAWLCNHMGRPIHFSEINDIELLQRIYSYLMAHKVILDNQRMIQSLDSKLERRSRGRIDNKKFRRYKRDDKYDDW